MGITQSVTEGEQIIQHIPPAPKEINAQAHEPSTFTITITKANEVAITNNTNEVLHAKVTRERFYLSGRKHTGRE